MKFKFYFNLCDFRIGIYYNKPWMICVCPLPFCMITISWAYLVSNPYWTLSFGESGDIKDGKSGKHDERIRKAELRIGALYRKFFDMRSRIKKLEGDKNHEQKTI